MAAIQASLGLVRYSVRPLCAHFPSQSKRCITDQPFGCIKYSHGEKKAHLWKVLEALFVLLNEVPSGLGQDNNLGWKSRPGFLESSKQVDGRQSGPTGLH